MTNIEAISIDKKIINVTSKRQVTIPLKFYEKLNFGKEVECFLTNGAIVIRPLVNNDDNFTMEILKDLVSQGYNGDELIAKFAEQKANIRTAVNILINEADEIATGKQSSATTKDIFGED